MLRPLRSAMLTIGLLAGVLAAVPALAAEGPPAPGFATPEDAVRAYLAGVADADVAGVLASAAIAEMATGFDFTAYTERLRAWSPYSAPAPATDPMLIEMNRAKQTAQLLGQTQTLVYSLLTTEDLDSYMVSPVDGAWAQSFIDQLDLSRLADLHVVAVLLADAELQAGPRYLENAAKSAAVQGADELTERVALVLFEDRGYTVGFTLLRYGDTWKVSSQSSAIAGTPGSGAATPVDAP
jgi:hypothetical protein